MSQPSNPPSEAARLEPGHHRLRPPSPVAVVQAAGRARLYLGGQRGALAAGGGGPGLSDLHPPLRVQARPGRGPRPAAAV